MRTVISNYIFGTQYEFGKPFTMVIDTRNLLTGSSNANQFNIPFRSSEVKALVDWGDGTFIRINAWNSPDSLHTYSNQGIYTIKIYTQKKDISNIYRISLMFYQNTERLKLLEVIQFGTLSLDANTFRGCTNLTMLNVIDLPSITNLAGTFSGCTSMTAINRISEWNVSSVTDFNTCFSGCTSFNQSLNSWNMTSATNISQMFSGCTVFNQPLNNWNVSNVTTIQSIFQNALAFNQSLNNWNVSNVTNMTGMFANAVAFNQPINNWSVGNVTNMNAMFQGATAFNQDISSWNFNINTTLTNFMSGKTFSNYNTSYYSNLLIKWSSRFVGTGRTQSSKTFNMGSIRYNSTANTQRTNLVNDGWTINDGGLI